MNNSELQMSKKLSKLRTIIQESLRVQRGSAEQVAYIDTGNVLADVCARQNHVIFARRGCGKTLLLHYSARQLGKGVHSVYLNCEDFKRHTFPNVLIEILDALFGELEKHLSAWFGRKARSKELIRKIRSDLAELQNGNYGRYGYKTPPCTFLMRFRECTPRVARSEA